MRFNDLVATVLAARADGEATRTILWRQCFDLLSQFDGGEADAQLDTVTVTLRGLLPAVAADRKLAAIAELGRRLRSPRLVALLMQDSAPVRLATLRVASLADGAWPAIIADAGPAGRSILRRRTDLGELARFALAAFGSTDMALSDDRIVTPEPEAPAHGPASAGDGSQIRRIVDRIERFTSERQGRTDASRAADASDMPPDITSFTFRTDTGGVIIAGHDAPEGALIGLAIAARSLDRQSGPDGQILGAFRRRGAFRDGRFAVSDGPLEGRWLIDAQPCFDAASGRFTGYRGHARRAAAIEEAPRSAAPSAETENLGNVPLRQLIHELRTPLSGVMGFAEIIESQLFGPVNEEYRGMAGAIVSDVHGLVDILEDIDLASRSPSGMALTREPVDCTALIQDAIATCALDRSGRARVVLAPIDPALPPVDVVRTMADRMVRHLVRAVAASATMDEVLEARCTAIPGNLHLEIDRPAALRGLDDAALFDPGYDYAGAGPDGPALGVGFALRLVRKLARASGGTMEARGDVLALRLPAARAGSNGIHRAP